MNRTTKKATAPEPIILLMCAVVFVSFLGLALYGLLYLGHDRMMSFIDWSTNDPVGRLVSLGYLAMFAVLSVFETMSIKTRTKRIGEGVLGAFALGTLAFLYMH